MTTSTCRCPANGEHVPGPPAPDGRLFCRWCGEPLIMTDGDEDAVSLAAHTAWTVLSLVVGAAIVATLLWYFAR